MFSPQGVAQPLTVSIGGVALDPEMSVSAHMRIADARLYAAKRQGRNLTVFDFDAKAAA
ncbi:MAG: GGDEF domain-containing protein [Rhizobiaceae bacterium]|nr:GGDEF domain-containing protein [Rhizobiaceae bacterium]